jgi:hypothetical protein
MEKMSVTDAQRDYLLRIIQADINSDRANDLEPDEAAFELEAKLVTMRRLSEGARRIRARIDSRRQALQSS